mgnify:CR=1 FL=1
MIDISDLPKCIKNKIFTFLQNSEAKLIKDFKYIENFYEKILVLLGQALNKTHSIDYSINFWRIFLLCT